MQCEDSFSFFDVKHSHIKLKILMQITLQLMWDTNSVDENTMAYRTSIWPIIVFFHNITVNVLWYW